MTNWMEGYTASWEVRMVDVSTWDDSDEITGVLSVEISRDSTDDVPLLETGSMEVDSSEFSWSWCRIYMRAEQTGVERHAMATLLFERSSGRFDHGALKVKASGRSVLQPAADRKMSRGAFAAKGTDGAKRAGELIAECTPAPVVVEGSFVLSDDVVFDLGCSHLKAAWQLVDAGGWCIQIDGRGVVYIRKLPTEPALELSMTTAGLLVPGVDDDTSIIDVPNRYFAINDDEFAVATNENPDSETGFQKRGRWVDEVDENPTLIDGENLEAYAIRMLAEKSTITKTYSYEREWWPDVMPYSLVRASIERHGISGELRVMKQDLVCGKGVLVKETAGIEVRP